MAVSTEASIPQKNQPYHTSNMKELIEASSFITWLMAAHLCRVILITISLQLLSNQNVLKLCFFTCQTPNSEKKNFNEQINKRHSKYAIKSQYTVTVIGSLISYKQLLDDVQHDIMSYQNSGLSYLLKLKAEVDNMAEGLIIYDIIPKPN